MGAGGDTCSESRAGASGFWAASNRFATGSCSVADTVPAAVGNTVARCNAAILDSCGFCFVPCNLALASATTACACMCVNMGVGKRKAVQEACSVQARACVHEHVRVHVHVRVQTREYTCASSCAYASANRDMARLRAFIVCGRVWLEKRVFTRGQLHRLHCSGEWRRSRGSARMCEQAGSCISVVFVIHNRN